MADAEQLEGVPLESGGSSDEPEAGQRGVGRGDGIQADRGQVGEQAAEAVHGQGGRGVLGGGLGQGAGGTGGWSDRAGAGGGGSGLVVVGEQQRREPRLRCAACWTRSAPPDSSRFSMLKYRRMTLSK